MMYKDWLKLTQLLLIICSFFLFIGCVPSKVETVKNYDESDPANIQLELGVGYLKQGNYEVALEKLKKSLEFNPKLVKAHSTIAVLYETIGKIRLAGRHHQRAVSLAPNDGAVRNNYGSFLCKQGNYEEAIDNFNAALASTFYKSPETAYANIGLCEWKQQNMEKAENNYRKALAINPELTSALYQMAELSYEKKAYLQARAFMQRYESLQLHNASSLLLALKLEEAQGDVNAARVYREELLKKFPNSEQVKELLKGE